MADTDLIGIFSLLLAAGGGAYLLWGKAAGERARAVLPRRRLRAADTIPPVLRPEADMPKKLKASSNPPPKSSEGKLAARGSVSSMKTAAAAPATNGASAKSNPPAATRSGSHPPAPGPKQPSQAPPPKKASVPPVAKKKSRQGGAAADELPSFEVEEDEELQPTKVGKIVERASIRPAIDKIVFDEDADAVPPLEEPAKRAVYAVAQTHTGKRRKHNEDSYLLIDEDAVFIVADGMGGHRGGEYASKLAVKTMGNAFASKTFNAEAHTDVPLIASELARAIQMANTAIQDEAKRRPQLAGMGTTLCSVRFSADRSRMYIGHVGDSRCYRLRDGVMKQMTTDHTMAGYGVAGPEGAHLSRAVGVWPTVPIDIIMATPEIGDVYLLCSDGLTKMIPDGTIATQLLHEEDPHAAVERLVFFANAHGGKDNITVIVVRIVEPGWQPPPKST